MRFSHAELLYSTQRSGFAVAGVPAQSHALRSACASSELIFEWQLPVSFFLFFFSYAFCFFSFGFRSLFRSGVVARCVVTPAVLSAAWPRGLGPCWLHSLHAWMHPVACDPSEIAPTASAVADV